MKNIFIVPGYGIPKNILEDQPYKKYLGLVFNYIFETCTKTNSWAPIIIFCGGPTDVFKPYKRTEAEEMKKLFWKYTKRGFVKNYTKKWNYNIENISLSTVENILFAKKIADEIKSKKNFYIFGEYTRKLKIQIFAKKIIGKNFKVVPFDFDLSINRYRDPQFIQKKEKIDIKFGLKAIADKNFLIEYRKLFIEKLAYLRKMGPTRHKEAINVWWKEKVREFEKMGTWRSCPPDRSALGTGGVRAFGLPACHGQG
jgi:hypothetical protein